MLLISSLIMPFSTNLTSLTAAMSMLYFWSSEIMALLLSSLFELGLSSIVLLFQYLFFFFFFFFLLKYMFHRGNWPSFFLKGCTKVCVPLFSSEKVLTLQGGSKTINISVVTVTGWQYMKAWTSTLTDCHSIGFLMRVCPPLNLRAIYH